ncbi:doxx family protein [Maribacter sp. ANRC-HE7]|uniref:Doxx family protein n=2 Tax=Maribacter aquimaris TaxID=2737171 RepID=A0ABR7V7C9_9FLAO|nr:doxx family protein [Maribacter aquimaris]
MMPIAIGIVYLWFGALKFFPDISPAEDLAKTTIYELTFGLIPSETTILLLAFWEITIGILLILNVYKSMIYWAAIIHITLTFTPWLFFPSEVFQNNYFQLTLLGQYIAKNIVILAALVVLLKEEKIKTKEASVISQRDIF